MRWGSSYFRSISDLAAPAGGTLLGPVRRSLRGWGLWNEDPGHAPNKRFAFASFLKKQIRLWHRLPFSHRLQSIYRGRVSQNPGRLVMLCDRARILARSDRPETMP